jgi:hypothetical protein
MVRPGHGPVALVISDMSISLDGYVTGPNESRENPFGDGAEMLHDCPERTDEPLTAAIPGLLGLGSPSRPRPLVGQGVAALPART